jgi:hypothetical protein
MTSRWVSTERSRRLANSTFCWIPCSLIPRVANYLTDLRTHRPSRPLGSRPLPVKSATFSGSPVTEPPPHPPPPESTNTSGRSSLEATGRSSSALSHRRANPAIPSMGPSRTDAGRPLVKEPHAGIESRDFSPTNAETHIASPNFPYRETEARRGDKNEARALRLALEELDLQEEQRLHSAAQDEAAELVWQHKKHKNPQESGTPYKNPDFKGPKSRLAQLEQGFHTRSRSLGRYGGLNRRIDQDDIRGHRSVSDSSSGSNTGNDGTDESGRASTRKKYTVTFAVPSPSSGQRRSNGHRSRNVSGDSGKGLFRNPDDQIYEEPEDLDTSLTSNTKKSSSFPTPLNVKPRNSLPRGARELPDRAATTPVPESKKLSRFDIHRNPPSQSRNPLYTSNNLSSTPPESTSREEATKDGIEIRGDDIRAATSMRLKDRSPKLPQPTIVSDRPGRPIVSFDRSWKPRETESRKEEGSNQNSPLRGLPNHPMPPSSVSAPIVPTNNAPGDSYSHPSSRGFKGAAIHEKGPISMNSAPLIPTLNLPDDVVSSTPSVSVTVNPSISVSDDSGPPAIQASPETSNSPSRGRPLPTPTKVSSSIAARTQKPRPHVSPSLHSYRKGPTATCTACFLPISGRIVTACSHRFHPECFSCHHCSEPLECVAFYPEPENKRAERIERGGEDADDGWRFFCHLDFHEFFSPRCRSCKTPIEGEVVVAAGGEWHVGHFFCAECGDV